MAHTYSLTEDASKTPTANPVCMNPEMILASGKGVLQNRQCPEHTDSCVTSVTGAGCSNAQQKCQCCTMKSVSMCRRLDGYPKWMWLVGKIAGADRIAGEVAAAEAVCVKCEASEAVATTAADKKETVHTVQ